MKKGKTEYFDSDEYQKKMEKKENDDDSDDDSDWKKDKDSEGWMAYVQSA